MSKRILGISLLLCISVAFLSAGAVGNTVSPQRVEEVALSFGTSGVKVSPPGALAFSLFYVF